ncbi:hypothetical protein EDC04DRAFT_2607327 [Pisolithus marmoratus]|nr:hypothetical protein EDC04DRAFT_2607327 [Pisolithus marmoratus]
MARLNLQSVILSLPFASVLLYTVSTSHPHGELDYERTSAGERSGGSLDPLTTPTQWGEAGPVIRKKQPEQLHERWMVNLAVNKAACMAWDDPGLGPLTEDRKGQSVWPHAGRASSWQMTKVARCVNKACMPQGDQGLWIPRQVLEHSAHACIKRGHMARNGDQGLWTPHRGRMTWSGDQGLWTAGTLGPRMHQKGAHGMVAVTRVSGPLEHSAHTCIKRGRMAQSGDQGLWIP